MERVGGLLLGAWALVDLLQLPLVAAVLLAWRLTRTLGSAWKATAVAFGGYALWVIAGARLVPYAPSGFALLVVGTLLTAPWRGATPECAWLAGSAAAVAFFWVLPVAVVRRVSRGARPPGGRGRSPDRSVPTP